MSKLFKISYQKGWAFVDSDEIAYIRYYPGNMYSKEAGKGAVCIQLKHGKLLEVYDVSEESADKYLNRWKEAKGIIDLENPLDKELTLEDTENL